MMLSCKKEDTEALEYEMEKAVRNDREYNSIYSFGSSFLKLDKYLCGQWMKCFKWRIGGMIIEV